MSDLCQMSDGFDRLVLDQSKQFLRGLKIIQGGWNRATVGIRTTSALRLSVEGGDLITF
jgi:hypothetical protein